MKRLIGILALLAGVGLADTSVPGTYHYAVLERNSDCTVYASLGDKASGRKTELEEMAGQIKKLAAERRNDLEKCGASRGISAVLRSQEEQLAGLCREEYSNWLDSGTSLIVVETDLKDIEKQLGKLKKLASYYCQASSQ